MDKFKSPRPNAHATAAQTSRPRETPTARPGVAQPQARVAQPQARVAQLKGAQPPSNVRPPAATPARPAAPPAYRPQPTPKVLQRKQDLQSKPAVAAAPPHARRDAPPTAAHAQRTRPKEVVQPKKIVRPGAAAAPQTPRAQGVSAARPRPAAPTTPPQRPPAAVQAKPGLVSAHGKTLKGSNGAARHPAPVVQRTASRGGPPAKGVIQCGLVFAFDASTDTSSPNVRLDENEKLAALMLAKDIEKILVQAQSNVDEGLSTTNSAAALLRDTGSRARSAKRGTAIHAETYEIIGNQLKGFGDVEQKVQGGRADIILTLFGSGKKVIFDLTSYAQGTKTHTSDRGYEKDKSVALIIEITYDDY